MTTRESTELIDLTHALHSGVPSWDGDCGFRLTTAVDYSDCRAPDLFRVHEMVGRAGIGTHIDAPAHCYSGAPTVESLELESLVTACATIRVDHVADENFMVMPDVVTEFERLHGRIAPRSFVMFYTGWDHRWPDPARYRNDLRFPAVHESTARLLLEREIAGLGTDTLSADAGGRSFPVHRAILGAGKYLVENVANAAALPPTGATIFIMPMKIQSATEAPVRLAAMKPNR